LRKIPLLYMIVAALVLLINVLGYYLPFIENIVSLERYYMIMLPVQFGVLVWFLVLVFRNAPLNENISIFMVVYFFLQFPWIVSFGLRDVHQLYDFVDMMTMIVLGFSIATLFILTIVDIWPGYVSLLVFALVFLRFLNLSWMNLFTIYDTSKGLVLGTVIYCVLAIGVIFLEGYTLDRFYELEE